MRYTLPQPYEDLEHTADLRIRVRGRTAEEALARLVLAFASVVAGGAPVEAVREERMAASAPGRALAAVALLRELLYRYATEGLVPAACEPVAIGPDGAEAIVAFGRRDPERHGEGADVKAVTQHAPRFEEDAGGWVAEVVLDV